MKTTIDNQQQVLLVTGFGESTSRQIDLRGIHVAKLVVGTFHLLLLDNDGIVYTLTNNLDGAISIINQFVDKNEKLDNVTVVDIAAGRDFSLFLSNENEMFGSGTNSYCQLSIPHQTTNSVSIPTYLQSVNEVLAGNIASMTCGSHFSVVLTKTNNLYAWGNNSNYQCEKLDSEYVSYPVEISFLRNSGIEKIALGWKHGLAINSTGELFSFGQRGSHLVIPEDVHIGSPMPSDCEYQPNPYFSRHAIKVLTASCGAEHSHIVSTTGQLYTCGSVEFHALGQHPDYCETLTPDFDNLKRLKIPYPVTSVTSGWHNCFVYCNNSTMFAFGENARKTISPDENDIEYPIPFLKQELNELKSYKMKHMGAGGQIFAILLEKGMTQSEERICNKLHSLARDGMLNDVSFLFE
jgi:alpha-tubulin suppressor-like RCC1 family protein